VLLSAVIKWCFNLAAVVCSAGLSVALIELLWYRVLE